MATNAARRYSPPPGWRPVRTWEAAQLRVLGPDRACELRCYPPDDMQFKSDALRAMSDGRRRALGWDQLLEEVRGRMKQLYPCVTIQPRHPMAAGDDQDELWYCYRDGALIVGPGT